MSSTTAFSDLPARVREYILLTTEARLSGGNQPFPGEAEEFERLALDLFALQYVSNRLFRLLCDSRKRSPQNVTHWTEIPAVPAGGFKELDFSCLAPAERTTVFHSSGTTGQLPSRHFHSAASLAVYEHSLWSWFKIKVPESRNCRALLSLTPPAPDAPHSSLVHMIETIRRRMSLDLGEYAGRIEPEGSWRLDGQHALEFLATSARAGQPVLVFGTAFSFVRLLEFMEARRIAVGLPAGSLVFETGGYKGRSRALPKDELHGLLRQQFGISSRQIVCEYGMSELSSQAYARPAERPGLHGPKSENGSGIYEFPPWARVRILSPETGAEVGEGGTGLVCVFDLANVCSVMGVETEDLAVRRDTGFELVGRASIAEPRGCSLMAAG